MRISTAQSFEAPKSLMASLNEKAAALQTQIATNSRFTAPSDDSVAYQRLQGLGRATANDTTYAANVKLAQGLVSQTDSTLDSISTQLQRAKELATQAANGTLNDSDRAGIAETLKSIADDLYSLANTKDTRGQPLFGGADGGTAFTRADDATIQYAGSGAPAQLPIGDGASIQPTVSGDTVFGGPNAPAGTTDVFALLNQLSTALAGGGDINQAMAAGLDGLNAAVDQVSSAQASIGARGARLDLEATRIGNAQTDRAATRADLEEPDVTSTITELQKTLTVLQATQASFTKLSSMSLFDYLK